MKPKKRKTLQDFYDELDHQNSQRDRGIYERVKSTLEEKGFVENSKGELLYKVKSQFGTLIYMYNPEEIKNFYNKLAHSYIGGINNLPITVEALKELIELPEKLKILEFEIEMLSEDERIEVESISNKSLTHYRNKTLDMLAESLYRFALEGFCRGILATSGNGYHFLKKTESAVFKDFLKIINESLKERLNIKKSSGNKPKRTEEQLLEFLDFYNKRREVIKKARLEYRMIEKKELSKIHDYKTRQSVLLKKIKAKYPMISDDTIHNFRFKGISYKDLAIEELKTHFNLEIGNLRINELLIEANVLVKNSTSVN